MDNGLLNTQLSTLKALSPKSLGRNSGFPRCLPYRLSGVCTVSDDRYDLATRSRGYRLSRLYCRSCPLSGMLSLRPAIIHGKLAPIRTGICDCWNSIAVMFDLHCSKFELFCSEQVRSSTWFGTRGSEV